MNRRAVCGGRRQEMRTRCVEQALRRARFDAPDDGSIVGRGRTATDGGRVWREFQLQVPE